MAWKWREADEIDCPKCKQALKITALACPHCGVEFTQEEANARAKSHRRNGFIGCAGLSFVSLALLSTCMGGDNKESEKVVSLEERQKIAVEQTPDAPLNRDNLEGIVKRAKQIYAAEAVACESAFSEQLNDDTVKAVKDGHEEIKKWGKYDFSKISNAAQISTAMKSCESARAAFDALPVTGVEKIDPARSDCSARYGHMQNLLARFQELVANKGSDDAFPLFLDTWSYEEGSYHNLKEEWHAECRLAILALPTR
jgi:hypothetical protein